MARVLNIASNRWNSAIAEYALSTGNAIKSLGHDVLMVTLEDAPLTLRSQAAGIATEVLPSFSVKHVLRMRQILNDFKPTVIITHGGPETVLAGVASLGKIHTIRVRGYAFDASGILPSLTHDAGLPGVKVIVTPAVLVEKQIKAVSNIPVMTIPLGVDTSKYFFEPNFTKPDRPELLIFGRFDPVKGHGEFMKIFKIVLRDWDFGQRPRLKIVGDPANVSVRHLEEFAAEAGLIWGEDVIVTTGRVEVLSRLLSSVTCGVISSLGSEIICRVAQEFLLCGTSVIVSGAGSLDEVLVESEFGVSYHGMQTEDAAAVIGVAIKKARLETLADKARRAELAKKAFSLETMATRWRSILEDAPANS